MHLIVKPKMRGFICTNAHPAGCSKKIHDTITRVQKQYAPIAAMPKRVLILGCSTGYGLASHLLCHTMGINQPVHSIGVMFERPPEGDRTASAGWYQNRALTQAIQSFGHTSITLNGDAFSEAIKEKTVEAIQAKGPIDLIIYSLAAPKRTIHQQTYQSVLKPIGQPYLGKTADILTGTVRDVRIEPATDEEIQHTIRVMGGDDWLEWIRYLSERQCLNEGVQTFAYSYIGPSLTAPLYRDGTIGQAKVHLEQTSHIIDDYLKKNHQGHGFVSVNKAILTQASAAIPVVPLYNALLNRLMRLDGIDEDAYDQIARLFAYRYGSDKHAARLDEHRRIRIDEIELQPALQQRIQSIWPTITNHNLFELTHFQDFINEFHQLFGFCVEGIHEDQAIDIH